MLSKSEVPRRMKYRSIQFILYENDVFEVWYGYHDSIKHYPDGKFWWRGRVKKFRVLDLHTRKTVAEDSKPFDFRFEVRIAQFLQKKRTRNIRKANRKKKKLRK